MITTKHCASAFCLGAVGLIGAGVAQAEVIYHENWTNTGTAISGSAGVKAATGWEGYWGSNAAITVDSRFQLSSASADVIEQASVNSNPGTPDNQQGFIFLNGTGAPYINFTDEYTIDRSSVDYSALRFQLDTNGDTGNPLRFVVRIGGDWYATQAASGLVAGGWGPSNTDNRYTVDFSTASWAALTFDPGDTLALGSATTLPGSGDIDAFGFFSDAKTGSSRFDDYHIEIVPEPGSMTLASLGTLMLLRRKRNA